MLSVKKLEKPPHWWTDKVGNYLVNIVVNTEHLATDRLQDIPLTRCWRAKKRVTKEQTLGLHQVARNTQIHANAAPELLNA